MELIVNLLCCSSPIERKAMPLCPSVAISVLAQMSWKIGHLSSCGSLLLDACHSAVSERGFRLLRPQTIGNVFPQQQHACQVLRNASISSVTFEIFEANSQVRWLTVGWLFGCTLEGGLGSNACTN